MKKILFGVTIPLTARIFLVPHLHRLSESGWDVHLASDPGAGESSLNSWIPNSGVNFHPLPTQRDPRPIHDLISLVRWISLVNRLHPDVIVYSTPKASLLASIASRILRVPTRIYHLRGLRLEGQSGFPRWFSSVCEKMAMSFSTDIICDSESLRLKVLQLNLTQSNKPLVLGDGSCSGVNTGDFRPATIAEKTLARERYSLPEEDLLIGFIGRVTPDKGIREMVEAVEELRNNGAKTSLIIIGPRDPGANELNSYLESTNRSWLILEEPISDTTEAFWAFDIFCSPSYREGFPVGILEAQSCGLPVVTTRVTGCIDAINDGVTGLLAEPADSDSLCRKLADLIASESLRRQMSVAARIRVIERFEQALVVSRWTRFIESTASSGRSNQE
jgi:glycosyltransferase involved in cell wall biosynthesis